MPPQLSALPPALSSLNGFDWFLLLTLLFSTFLAFRKGIVRVLVSLGGLIAGILLAAWNYTGLARLLSPVVPNQGIAEVISFLLILVAVTVASTFVARVLRQTVSAAGLGIVDRLFGALFGCVRGLLFGASALLALTAFAPDAAWIRNSVLAPYFLRGAHAVSFVVPEAFQQQFTEGANKLLQDTPQFLRPGSPKQPLR